MDQDACRGEFEVVYANFFQVGHNAVEFLLDFGRDFEEFKDRVLVRVVTNPAHAKVFSNMLRRALEQYEVRFGSIQDLEDRERSS